MDNNKKLTPWQRYHVLGSGDIEWANEILGTNFQTQGEMWAYAKAEFDNLSPEEKKIFGKPCHDLITNLRKHLE